MTFGPYTIHERRETRGGGFDALATDASGKDVCLWVGAPGVVTTPHGQGPDEVVARIARVYHSSLPRPVAGTVIEDRAVVVLPAYRGRRLGEGVAADRAPDVPDAIDRVRTVAGALVKAHRAGIVHGKIDADEILLAEDGRTLLLHLGFEPFLVPGAAGGPAATGPEPSAHGSPPPAEAGDVLALSRILVRWVAGEGPFRDAEDFPAELPQGLRRLLARAIHPDEVRRLSRAEELTGDLAVIRASWGVSGPDPEKHRHRLLAGAAAVVVGGTAVALALRGC